MTYLADGRVDKSRDTTNNETTTTETTTNNTTIVVVPECEKVVTERTVESGFWSNRVTTTTTDSCTKEETVIVSPELTGFSILFGLVLGALLIATAILMSRGRFDAGIK